MSLEDLNKHLHSNKDYEDIHQKHDVDEYNPFDQADIKGDNPFNVEHEWKEPQKGLTAKQKKILKIIGVVVSVLALAGLALWGWNKWKERSFLEDRVVVSIEGPNGADSMQQMEYSIKCTNSNMVALHDVEINLSYAENFQPIDNVNFKYLSKTNSKVYVGDIGAKKSISIPLKGIFYAPKDYQVYLRASLDYTVSGRNGTFHAPGQLGVDIDSAPILLDVVAPKEASNGDSVEYVVDFKNLDTRSLVNMQIRAEFPEGFEFVSATPSPSEGSNVWYMGAVESDQGQKIRIQGRLKGSPDDGKTLKVSVGTTGDDGTFVVYNQRTMNTRMVNAALSINQKIEDGAENGIIRPGGIVRYLVEYSNNSNIGMRNAVVTMEILSKVIDYAELKSGGGSFDETKKTITWKAADIPALANIQPGAKGQLRVEFPIKAIIPVDGPQDKNFTLRTVAKIDSPDIPTVSNANKIIGSSILELKLSSKIIIETLGYYGDTNIKNSGPMPPKVGNETTYTLHWTIFNVSNELQDAILTADLPSGNRWTGKIFPENEKIEYDSNTNKITWKIGSVNPGVGILGLKREVSFQIGIIPQQNQTARALTLLNGGNFVAKDAFTGEKINIQLPAKDSQLLEDKSIPPGGYLVE